MAFNPKDAVDAARDIATNAVEKASDIVEHAGDIIRGDILRAAPAASSSTRSISALTRWNGPKRCSPAGMTPTNRRGQTAAASLSSSSRVVAARYSCTQRSMTVALFSTLVNCPTT